MRDTLMTPEQPQSPKRAKADPEFDEWCDVDTTVELASYLSQSPGDDSDLLQWWSTGVFFPSEFWHLQRFFNLFTSQQVSQFPKLSQIAWAVLCIPATSASSEREFSIAGELISARRSSFDPANVNNILFLHKYFKNNTPK